MSEIRLGGMVYLCECSHKNQLDFMSKYKATMAIFGTKILVDINEELWSHGT